MGCSSICLSSSGTRCDLGTSRSPKWLKVGKWRRMTPLFKNSHSPSKKTVVSMFLVVVDNITHTNYGKKFWNFFSNLNMFFQGSKLDRSSLIKPVIQNGQLYKFGELVLWWFSPGRHFLSNNIHFSNDFATLRCSKFIIFTIFLLFQKIYPKSDAEWCRGLRT